MLQKTSKVFYNLIKTIPNSLIPQTKSFPFKNKLQLLNQKFNLCHLSPNKLNDVTRLTIEALGLPQSCPITEPHVSKYLVELTLSKYKFVEGFLCNCSKSGSILYEMQ
jgi:hypothetical protein